MDNQSILKKRVDLIIKEALFCKNHESSFLHLLVISDSVKSLIGIDINNPPLILLDWIEEGVKNSNKEDYSFDLKKPDVKTISYKQLQEALINGNKKSIEGILFSLQSLTDGTQLSEFLLEMSLLQTGESFICIWRISKAMNFAKPKNRFSFYKLMCRAILQDTFRENNSKNKEVSNSLPNKSLNMIVYSHILDCKSHLFIREEKLLAALDRMLSYITVKNKIKNSISLHQESIEKNRASVLTKLEDDEFRLSKKNILLLDSIRMLIKNAPKINDKVVSAMYEKLRDDA